MTLLLAFLNSSGLFYLVMPHMGMAGTLCKNEAMPCLPVPLPSLHWVKNGHRTAWFPPTQACLCFHVAFCSKQAVCSLWNSVTPPRKGHSMTLFFVPFSSHPLQSLSLCFMELKFLSHDCFVWTKNIKFKYILLKQQQQKLKKKTQPINKKPQTATTKQQQKVKIEHSQSEISSVPLPKTSWEWLNFGF